jgi:hypothetical protein
MTPLAFNLKDAKKTAGDKHSTTFTLKGGHVIKVAHAPLPALQRKALERLPVYLEAGGPPVPRNIAGPGPGDAAMASEVAENQQQAADEASDQDEEDAERKANYAKETAPTPPQVLSGADDNDVMNTPPPQDQSRQVPVDLGQTPPSTQAPTYPQSPYESASLEGAINSQMQGVEARGAAAQAEAKSLNNIEVANQKTLADAQAAMNTLNTSMAKDMNDAVDSVKAGRINPNHYMENMGAVQKVGTAIGLALGGFSSAFTHQGNPAQQWLNEQINRDVTAQQQNLNHKSTIFHAYLEKYQNAHVAQQMTLATQQAITASKIRAAGATAGGAQAQANTQILAGQYEQQAVMSKNNALLIHAASAYTNPAPNAPTSGTEAGLQQVINAARTIGNPIAQQLDARYIPGIGMAAQTATTDDKKAIADAGEMANLAKQALALSYDKNITVRGSPANQRAADLQQQLGFAYARSNELKRFSPELQKRIDAVVMNPGSWNQPQAQQSLKDIQSFAALHVQSIANRLRIVKFAE